MKLLIINQSFFAYIIFIPDRLFKYILSNLFCYLFKAAELYCIKWCYQIWCTMHVHTFVRQSLELHEIITLLFYFFILLIFHHATISTSILYAIYNSIIINYLESQHVVGAKGGPHSILTSCVYELFLQSCWRFLDYQPEERMILREADTISNLSRPLPIMIEWTLDQQESQLFVDWMIAIRFYRLNWHHDRVDESIVVASCCCRKKVL